MTPVAAYFIDVPDPLLDRAIEEGVVFECDRHGSYEAQNVARLHDWLDVNDPTEGSVTAGEGGD